MKATLLFVALQYIIGFSFAVGGIFLFSESDNSFSLNASIFYGFLIGFICMLIGVWLVGYFHLRVKHVVRRLPAAIALSLLGLLLFLFLDIFIDNFLPSELGILILFLPLTGAVFGFNLVATRANKREAN